MKLYDRVADYYDQLFKIDYEQEVKVVNELLKKHGLREGHLLDVGCGVGGHLQAFQQKGWVVEGLDSSKEMLEVAQKKLKNVILHQGRMQSMRLSKSYDVITLLSRTLLFLKNKRDLKNTLTRVWKHLTPRGVLIINLDLHEFYFDADKSETNYFSNDKAEGSITEEYDEREGKVLWSINLSIKKGQDIERLVDNQEYLMINPRKLIKLMKTVGFRPIVYDLNGEVTSDYNQPLIIIGVKIKRRK